jgi:hypothetical protein
MCLGASGTCSCFDGYTSAACQDCAPSHLRVGGSACVFLPGALVSCTDQVRNGDEEGVDCGGTHCPAPCQHPVSIVRQVQARLVVIVVVNVVTVVGAVLVAIVVRHTTWCPGSCCRRCRGTKGSSAASGENQTACMHASASWIVCVCVVREGRGHIIFAYVSLCRCCSCTNTLWIRCACEDHTTARHDMMTDFPSSCHLE